MKPTIVHDNRAQEREFINKRAFKKINSLEKIITFYEKNGLRDRNDTKIKTEKKNKKVLSCLHAIFVVQKIPHRLRKLPA